MERAPTCPPKFFVYEGNRFTSRGRHCHSGQNGNRRHNEYCREICELLHRVVAIEAVRLWRKVEVVVQHEGISGLQEYILGGGHQTFPLRAGQKTDDEEGPGEHKPVTVMKWQNRGTPTVWR